MIKFIDGDHAGKELKSITVTGFLRFTFEECGCQYEGFSSGRIAQMHFMGSPSTEAVPDVFKKAFSTSA